YRLDRASPAFLRTLHCNVIYELEVQSSDETPAPLAAAVGALVGAASGQDEACRGLGYLAVTSRPSLRFPWPAVLGIAVLFCLLGAAWRRLGSGVPLQTREWAFLAAVVVIAAVGAHLRAGGIDLPLREGAATWRIQLAASSAYDLLSMERFDYRHPPMTSLLLHAALAAGRDETTLRLPFVLASVLSIPAVAALGRELGGRTVGVGACLVAATATSLVDTGARVGSHALFLLVAPLVLLAHLELRREPSRARWMVLGLVDAAVLWTHYFGVILLALQAADAAIAWTRRPASSHAVALGKGLVVASVLGSLPIVYFFKGVMMDRGVRAHAAAAPEALWGAGPVGEIVTSAVGASGVHFTIMLLALALAGSAVVVLHESKGIWTACAAWLIPLGVLAAAPVLRMRGVYMAAAVPLLSIVAMVGAVHGPRLLADRLLSARTRMVRNVAAGGAAGFLAAALCAAAVFYSTSHGVPDLHAQGSRTGAAAMASVIRSQGTRPVVIVQDDAHSLLGFYLSDEVEPPGKVEAGAREWRYGGHRVHALCGISDLQGGWKETAEGRLREIVDEQGLVWLADLGVEASAWAELISAGRCRLHTAFDDGRLLVCGP
ncbi:MAG: glycosyltransferase family 39 protein, partial [Deltaproteobacteria bacterium]|nr:glycosyltransferase family 39 protein [Deltaproteobacteria bacterium]